MGARLPEFDAGKVVSDAWDFKGCPAVRASTGGWTSAVTIVVVEVGERLTSLGIAVNLVTYLTGTMHLGNAHSANVVTDFLGASFLFSLLGGFVADTLLGRYHTIAISAALQATGVTVLAFGTAVHGLRPPPGIRASSSQLLFLNLGLNVTALGTGALKSSVSGFGSDQFDEADEVEKRQMMQFFHWFFFLISLGSLLAVTLLVYVQDNVGRSWGYGICAICIFGGLVVFLIGTKRYRFKKIVGSPLTQIAAVVVSALRKRSLPLPSDPALYYDVAEVPETTKRPLPRTSQFRVFNHAAVKESSDEASPWRPPPSKWRLNTVTDVEEVKQVLRMLPIWATTIMFWTVYAQATTFSVSQATTMDRRITAGFEIPPASLTVFFVGSILLTVPIYDRAVVPIARRVTGNPHGLTPLQRMGVGLALSILAMVAAALAEIRRLHVAKQHGAALTVFYLVPQFLLTGTGQAFTYIGQLDFFLRECPTGMKTMSTGLFLSTMALGFFLSSGLVSIVHRLAGRGVHGAWLADDLNMGKLYDFYWLLAVLSFINLLAFVAAARWYRYKDTGGVVAAGDGNVPDHVVEAEMATTH